MEDIDYTTSFQKFYSLRNMKKDKDLLKEANGGKPINFSYPSISGRVNFGAMFEDYNRGKRNIALLNCKAYGKGVTTEVSDVPEEVIEYIFFSDYVNINVMDTICCGEGGLDTEYDLLDKRQERSL